MKERLKKIGAALIAVYIIITGVPALPVSAATAQPTTYSKEYNSGTRDVVCTTLNGTSASSYYTGNYIYEKLSALSKDSLKSQLHTLMTSTHKTTSSYNDCHHKADKTDCENENKKVSLIYTSYDATMNQWDGWNREHVWPKSLGGNNTSGGGADLHHIRPSDAVVNSTRGNKKYGYAGSGATKVYGKNPATGYLGGSYNTYFEPLDNVKGDVARICLYVYVRWGSAWGADSITEVFQSVDVLLEWCALDPVDTWEMGRNEVVQKIQGNRNVFIDYPEYAWQLYGKTAPSNMTTPSGEAANGGNGGNSGGGNTEEETTTPVGCQHTSTRVEGAVAATCKVPGYTGNTICNSCGKTVVTGSEIPVNDNHTFGAWAPVEGSEFLARICIVCNKEEKMTCVHAAVELRGVVEANCGGGYTGDTYCLVCGVKTASGEKLDPIGEHAWGEWTTVDGSAVEVRECTVCHELESKNCLHETTEIKNAVAADCRDGYTGDTYCTVCGEKVADGEKITATESHKWGEWTYVDGQGEVRQCATCQDTETRDCAHTTTEIRDAVEADCIPGYTGDTYCTACGEKISDGEEISPVGDHEFSKWTLVEGTSTQTRICSKCETVEERSCPHDTTEIRGEVTADCRSGYTGDTYCTVCGTKTKSGTEISPVGDHTYGEWVAIEGTDKERHECTVCGHAQERVAPCYHKNTEIRDAKEPTEAVDGYTGDTYCTDCGELISFGDVIAATGTEDSTVNGNNVQITVSGCESSVSSGAVIIVSAVCAIAFLKKRKKY